jgi:hypothetical protein
MDLLGAYDSNSDSDNDLEKHEQQYQQSNLPTVQNGSKSGLKDVHADSAFPTTNNLHQKTQARSAKEMKRGKKILKLAGILPHHIWDQLTAGTIGDGESDNDEEVNNAAIENLAEKASSQFDKCDEASGKGRQATNRKDLDLQKLLQELPKSKAVSSVKIVSILRDAENDNADDTRNDDEKFTPQQVNPGTTNSQRTSKDCNPDIFGSPVDAHCPLRAPVDKKSLTVPSTFSSNKQHYLPKPTVTRVLPLRPAAPFPKHGEGAATTVSSLSAPVSSTPYIHDKQSATSSREVVSSGTRGKKKMSRKRQMEQMLRAGKIHDFEGDYELEGSANVYEHSEFDSVPTYQGHGLRVVPTSSYNVSAGTTVTTTEISGRQRNKHQLNSLLANAASLEARRMQNPHVGSGASGGSGASQRASAKWKYGW